MKNTPKELVPKFFEKTASSYDKIVHWTTFGKDIYWKNEILKKIPNNSKSILDLACGTGILTRKIARQFPNSIVVGIDITENYLNIAKKHSKSFPNIVYLLQDAEKLEIDSKFDCITSSYIPKYCNPEILVKKCLEHLKPGGIIILHDFLYPTNCYFQKIWNFYFVLLGLLVHFFPEWKNVFTDLPKLIRQIRWFEEFEATLQNNNFQVEKYTLTWRASGIIVGKHVGKQKSF